MTEECEGWIVNITGAPDCLCKCSEDDDIVNEGVETIIGHIIGIKITDIFAYSYTLFILTLILMLFLMLFPPLSEKFYNFLGVVRKVVYMIMRKIPFCGKYAAFFFDYVMEFIYLLRIPESGLIILVGVCVGLVVNLFDLNDHLNDELVNFDNDMFALLLVPPILMKMGFYMERSRFFHNFILTFLQAIGGTFFTSIVLAFAMYFFTLSKYPFLQCLVLASALAGVDPGAALGLFQEIKVNRRLCALLSNEIPFRFVMTIILYEVFVGLNKNIEDDDYHLVGSIIGLTVLRILISVTIGISIGLFMGLFGCFVSRFTFHKHLVFYQPLIVFVFSWIAYFLCETFYSSGITGLFVCTFFMARYMKYNIVKSCRTTTKMVMNVLHSVAEGLIFLYLGMTIVNYDHDFDWLLIIVTNVSIVVIRFLYVYCLDIPYNFIVRFIKKAEETIPNREIFIQAFAGSCRGAISFALVFVLNADQFKSKDAFVTTAVSCIVVTTFIQGTLITPLLNFLHIKKRVLKASEKIDLYKHLEKTLKKILYFIPHPENPHDEILAIAIHACNHNFLKAKKISQNMLKMIEQERLQNQHALLKEMIHKEKHIVEYDENGHEKLPEVNCVDYDLVKKIVDFLGEGDQYIKDDPLGFGISHQSIQTKHDNRGVIEKYLIEIRSRIADLLKISQLKYCIVKVKEEEVTERLRVDSLMKEFTWVGEQRPEDSEITQIVRKSVDVIRFCMAKVDSWIQMLVNKGFNKKNKKFLRATFNYREYAGEDQIAFLTPPSQYEKIVVEESEKKSSDNEEEDSDEDTTSSADSDDTESEEVVESDGSKSPKVEETIVVIGDKNEERKE